MKEPLLSIIIVSYRDSSLLLKRTIQSVQTFEDYELVLTDANERGSACSKGLAEDMESYPDIPVICGEWKNCDLAAAKNAGAARAGGTYLTFLTTHDVWNLQCAKKQLEVLQADPDVGLTFGCMWEPAVSSVSQVIFGALFLNNFWDSIPVSMAMRNTISGDACLTNIKLPL